MPILRREDEPVEEVDVRECDQRKINEFGRINSRLYELRDDIKEVKKTMDVLEYTQSEVFASDDSEDGNLRLAFGDSYLNVTADEIDSQMDARLAVLKQNLEDLQEEETVIQARQRDLKAELYGRFGNTINLEDK